MAGSGAPSGADAGVPAAADRAGGPGEVATISDTAGAAGEPGGIGIAQVQLTAVPVPTPSPRGAVPAPAIRGAPRSGLPAIVGAPEDATERPSSRSSIETEPSRSVR